MSALPSQASPWVFAHKNNFSASELSSSMEGRLDTPLYQNGVKKMINWMVLPSGGIIRRPGTQLVYGYGEYLPEEITEVDVLCDEPEDIFKQIEILFNLDTASKEEKDVNLVTAHQKAWKAKLKKDQEARELKEERERHEAELLDAMMTS